MSLKFKRVGTRLKQFNLQDQLDYEALPERMRAYITAMIEDRLDEAHEELREEIIDDIRRNFR